MRKLIYAINLTLDGCCDHTKGIADEEIHDFHTRLLQTSDTFLYGRKTYELMVPFWPDISKNPSGDKSMDEFAMAFTGIRDIVVVSKTLKSPDEKTSIIKGNLREEVLRLKKEPGKPILTGGVDIPSQLIALDLVDEFVFVFQPVLAGEGRRLSPGIPEMKKLLLLDVTRFRNGGVAARYGKTPD
ncbi:MAG: dihydrofolate reductase [Chitinophagaceae bacterium]|nr:MAG: dihydrofolate reductase [Chitinophagaceae bacterium]